MVSCLHLQKMTFKWPVRISNMKLPVLYGNRTFLVHFDAQQLLWLKLCIIYDNKWPYKDLTEGRYKEKLTASISFVVLFHLHPMYIVRCLREAKWCVKVTISGQVINHCYRLIFFPDFDVFCIARVKLPHQSRLVKTPSGTEY